MLRTAICVLDRVVNQVAAVLCLLFFLICLYAVTDAVNVYLNANDNSILKYKPKPGQSAEVLWELSEDAVGWLTIDNSSIDYPVMQGRNNLIYVNTNPYGDFSLSGSIFLDSGNQSDFSDDFSMIYGHHMEHNAMFGALDEFYNKDYLCTHQSGVLITKEGLQYRLSIFASCQALATEELIFTPTDTDRETCSGILNRTRRCLNRKAITLTVPFWRFLPVREPIPSSGWWYSVP